VQEILGNQWCWGMMGGGAAGKSRQARGQQEQGQEQAKEASKGGQAWELLGPNMGGLYWRLDLGVQHCWGVRSGSVGCSGVQWGGVGPDAGG